MVALECVGGDGDRVRQITLPILPLEERAHTSAKFERIAR
jgi:hypothetical protein